MKKFLAPILIALVLAINVQTTNAGVTSATLNIAKLPITGLFNGLKNSPEHLVKACYHNIYFYGNMTKIICCFVAIMAPIYGLDYAISYVADKYNLPKTIFNKYTIGSFSKWTNNKVQCGTEEAKKIKNNIQFMYSLFKIYNGYNSTKNGIYDECSNMANKVGGFFSFDKNTENLTPEEPKNSIEPKTTKIEETNLNKENNLENNFDDLETTEE